MKLFKYVGVDKNNKTMRGTVRAENRDSALDDIRESTNVALITDLTEAIDNQAVNRIRGFLDGAVSKIDDTLTKQTKTREVKAKERRKNKVNKKELQREQKRKNIYKKQQRKSSSGTSGPLLAPFSAIKDRYNERFPQTEKEKREPFIKLPSLRRSPKQKIVLDEDAYSELLDIFKEQEEEFGSMGQLSEQHVAQVPKAVKKEAQDVDWDLIQPDRSERYNSDELFTVKVKRKEVVMITRRLQIMLASGVSLVKAISVLAEDADEETTKMLSKIADDIQSGHSFSEALSKFPAQFDNTYVSIVSIGESSGNLEDTLIDLIQMMEQQEEIRKKMISAAIYPAIIGFVLAAVLVLGSIFFIPMFEDIFSDLGVDGELPLLTRVVFGIAGVIPWVAAGIALFIFALIATRKAVPKVDREMKKLSSRFTLWVPIISDVVLIYHMHTFSSTVGMMINNGVRLNNSLLLAQNAITNVYIKSEIARATVMMMDGHSLSDSLRSQNYFDDILINIILVGEETGEMGFALNQIADFYQGELERKIDDLMSMVEPAFMIIIGLVAAPVIIGIYMPILDLSSGAGM